MLLHAVLMHLLDEGRLHPELLSKFVEAILQTVGQQNEESDAWRHEVRVLSMT